MSDPFERFERSRGGMAVPVIIFLLGAVPTMLSIRALDPLVVVEDPAANEQVDGPENDSPQDNLKARPTDEGLDESLPDQPGTNQAVGPTPIESTSGAESEKGKL